MAVKDIIIEETNKILGATELLDSELKDVSLFLDGEPYSGESFNLVSGNDAVLVLLPTQIPIEVNLNYRVVDYKNEIHLIADTSHYKFTNGEWITLPTPPIPVYSCGIVIFEDDIHILGSGNSSYYTKHYKFNGAEWSEVSTLPVQFCNAPAVVYKDKIHILGSMQSQSTHYAWDGNSWTSVGTMPYNSYNTCAAVHDDKIYWGGGVGDSNCKHLYEWNGSAWTKLADCGNSLEYGFLASIQGKLHAYLPYISGSPHRIWNGLEWEDGPQVSITGGTWDQTLFVIHNNDVHRLGGRYSSSTKSKNHYIVLRTYYKGKVV